MDIEFLKLILAYSLVAVFVFTAIVTSLSLVGWAKFIDQDQQKTLFKVLIVEVAIVSVGFFANLLEFNPVNTKNQLVAGAFSDRKQQFTTKLALAREKYKAGDLQNSYSMVNDLFRSNELSEYFPIRDLFILNGDISNTREFLVEAIESYGPALKLDPNNIELMVNAGDVQRKLQNYEAAENLYERAMNSQSQSWDVLNGYYNCLRRYAAFLADEYPKISDIKFQKALEIVNQMKSVATDSNQKRLSDVAKGTLYWEWKRYDIAQVTYQQLTVTYPEEKRFKEDLAAILIEMKKYHEAKLLYADLYNKEKQSNKVSWFVGSGYAEAASKDTSDGNELRTALDAGLLAISNKPDEPFSYYAVAMVYKKLGMNNDAIKSLRKAESQEASRDTNMHTYDKTRHLMYKKILREWGVKT
jgi:tetratricopeptide (TPR) repeat protein